jgi:hypothetical protein
MGKIDAIEEEPKILILAEHAPIAELLMEFCSIAGHRAVVSRCDETIEAACARTQPRLVILDFGLIADDRSPSYDALAEHGARLLLFSGCLLHARLRAHAGARGLPFFALPIAPQEFVPVLNAILDH